MEEIDHIFNFVFSLINIEFQSLRGELAKKNKD